MIRLTFIQNLEMQRDIAQVFDNEEDHNRGIHRQFLQLGCLVYLVGSGAHSIILAFSIHWSFRARQFRAARIKDVLPCR